ncbi:MAG: TorF family putative porin [Pseudomonadota bacterium]|nr:TorF family putative porin [Pseudomonadota bacterium]
MKKFFGGVSAAPVALISLMGAVPALAENTEETAVETSESAAADLTFDMAAQPKPAAINIDTDFARASAPLTGDESALGAESGITFSANVALTSEYRFRGVDLSGGNIAVQGGFDASHSSGFYVGTWASNLDEQTVGFGSLELDLYGGWSGNLTDAVSLDIGAIAYLYPDAGPGEFDYYEAYGSVGLSLGPVSSTTGIAYAFSQEGLDFGGGQRDNFYIYQDFSLGIPETPITLNAHVGYTDGVLTFTNDSKAFDWSLSADVALGGNFSASLAYVDAEGDIAPGAYNFTDAAVVATLSASF